MERPRPTTRRRDRKDHRLALIGSLALTGAILLTGCDSVSGIPGDEPNRATESTSASPSTANSTASTSATHSISASTPPVGSVPGLPGADKVAARFGADLVTATPTALQATCWMMAPANIIDIDTNSHEVLDALAQPGTLTPNAVTWKSANTTVTFDRTWVESGIENSAHVVCPWVARAGTEPGPDDADARHTVRRYLARSTGSPLDPSDKEDTYPLVCSASTWDPADSGTPGAAPLASNPGKLTGVTKFDNQEIHSEQLRTGYITVQVPVTSSSGGTQTRTFTLTEGTEGYCIGDVSP
ncbi:hypothetical protein [Nocardia australiensis]|uniref:hypothetical protein n=1 Tax=Nocardia australiensis TaxID=2887191 RepID=UPI001D13D334|nr:hypothetical protein [Nocardia australiensis]